jgi:hypothetical protein
MSGIAMKDKTEVTACTYLARPERTKGQQSKSPTQSQRHQYVSFLQILPQM